jgi:hypothetical protein
MKWIVETDGRGMCAVASDDGGPHLLTEPSSRMRAERALVRLRKRDVERVHRARVESGKRLAALRRSE